MGSKKPWGLVLKYKILT